MPLLGALIGFHGLRHGEAMPVPRFPNSDLHRKTKRVRRHGPSWCLMAYSWIAAKAPGEGLDEEGDQVVELVSDLRSARAACAHARRLMRKITTRDLDTTSPSDGLISPSRAGMRSCRRFGM
jgi:hypothetical protein